MHKYTHPEDIHRCLILDYVFGFAGFRQAKDKTLEDAFNMYDSFPTSKEFIHPWCNSFLFSRLVWFSFMQMSTRFSSA